MPTCDRDPHCGKLLLALLLVPVPVAPHRLACAARNTRGLKHAHVFVRLRGKARRGGMGGAGGGQMQRQGQALRSSKGGSGVPVGMNLSCVW